MKSLKHLSMLCLFGTISIITRAADISNNEIWYEATYNLNHSTSTHGTGSYTNAFKTLIKSHEPCNGKEGFNLYSSMTSIENNALLWMSKLTIVIR